MRPHLAVLRFRRDSAERNEYVGSWYFGRRINEALLSQWCCLRDMCDVRLGQ